jgi:hypothetical protein
VIKIANERQETQGWAWDPMDRTRSELVVFEPMNLHEMGWEKRFSDFSQGGRL